ncbi:MAG: DMT family transporter [Bacteroidales bacterium]|nr:DMT family transporter [Bacteroidales bacterium]RLD39653.1 MAG: EamA/RhaT family transporter [Bacteroidota bacterium]
MENRKNVILGAILISFSAILWGFDGVVLTPRLSNLNISFVVFILHLFPFLLMNLFLFKRYKLIKKLSLNETIALFGIAIFGGAIGTFSIVKALFLVDFQSLSIVVLLQKLQPIFAILLAATFLKERLGKNFILWAIVAIVAGYFLTFGISLPKLHESQNTIKAALFSVLAAFSFGSSTVFSKRLLVKLDFISAAFFRYGLTSLLMLIIVLGNGKISEFENVSTLNWWVIGIISLTTGSGAIFLYYYGLKHVRAIISTIAELFFPLSAVLFDYIFNNHILSPIQWLSAGVMIFAIIRLNADNKKQQSKT